MRAEPDRSEDLVPPGVARWRHGGRLSDPEGCLPGLYAGGYECSEAEGNGSTEAELRACAEAGFDTFTDIEGSLDGKAAKDLEKYVVNAPVFQLPGPNLFSDDPSPSVIKGVFQVVHPLSPGEHRLYALAEAEEFLGLHHISPDGPVSRLARGSNERRSRPGLFCLAAIPFLPAADPVIPVTLMENADPSVGGCVEEVDHDDPVALLGDDHHLAWFDRLLTDLAVGSSVDRHGLLLASGHLSGGSVIVPAQGPSAGLEMDQIGPYQGLEAIVSLRRPSVVRR